MALFLFDVVIPVGNEEAEPVYVCVRIEPIAQVFQDLGFLVLDLCGIEQGVCLFLGTEYYSS